VEAICDPQRTAQIVRVLLDNALRHTPDGTHVHVTATTPRASRKEAQLQVTDDGPGIEAGELPYIFDRFHTGNPGSGSGLGLAIAREMARRMGGRLEVESRPGRTPFALAFSLSDRNLRDDGAAVPAAPVGAPGGPEA
jgi:signal transduction histidine kinase